MKYAVGIDLGTSNSALAYADLSEQDPSVRVFEVPQLVAPETVQPRTLLPSHLYLASEHEQHAGSVLVGTYARDRGAQVPGRHVASAKSWLCHPSVDRTAAILPWGAPPEVPRLSPVQAGARRGRRSPAARRRQHGHRAGAHRRATDGQEARRVAVRRAGGGLPRGERAASRREGSGADFGGSAGKRIAADRRRFVGRADAR